MNERHSDSLFVVVDGLDGIGKGEIERALIGYEQKQGRTVFDTISFSMANKKGLPELSDFWNPPFTYYETILTAEPTYSGMGHTIRNEIIQKNGRRYSSEIEIEAYSLDRMVQMTRVVVPALVNGLRVIQSRSVASTLCYQSLRAEEEGRNPEETRRRILEHEGNVLQLRWFPDLLIIPTIRDVSELARRRENRQKEDNAIFERNEFQRKLKPLYESKWLRDVFEEAGSVVAYLDAGISEQETRRQAIEIYSSFVLDKKIPSNYGVPKF